jgi:hypothetical protein
MIAEGNRLVRPEHLWYNHSPVPLKTISITPRPSSPEGSFVARYELTHSTPGREGTCLSCPLEIRFDAKSSECVLVVKECTGGTPDESLARLAVWLRRLADGVDQRAPSVPVPLG